MKEYSLMKRVIIYTFAIVGLAGLLCYFQKLTSSSFYISAFVSGILIWLFSKRVPEEKKNKGLPSFFIFFGVLLACLSLEWALSTFPLEEPDQVILTLSSPLDGFFLLFLREYAIAVFIPSVLITISLIPWLSSISQYRKTVFILTASLMLVGTLGVKIAIQIPFPEYKRVLTLWDGNKEFVSSPFFLDNFTSVDSLKRKDGVSRNLVFVIMESMENWDSELIPEIERLKQNNISFSDGFEIVGSTSTISATVSKTTGVPYLSALYESDTILPNARSIYDLLRQNGYYNVFLQGTNAKFANLDDFLATHGIDELFDLKRLNSYTDMDSSYVKGDLWHPGITDRSLYEIAKGTLDTLSQKEHFSLTLATIETHFPKGFYDDQCLEKPKNSSDEEVFKATLRCASREVFEFVEWIQSREFGKNTTIVIVGDHLFKGKILTNRPSRRWIDVFINPYETPVATQRNFSSVDIAPSILESLGFEIPNHKMGFGVSLFSNEKTLIEKYEDIDYINRKISRLTFSPEYYQLVKKLPLN